MEIRPAVCRGSGIAKQLVRLGVLVTALAFSAVCSAAPSDSEPAWWSAFHDPALDLLLARGAQVHAHRGDGQHWEAKATAAYVKLRVAAAQAHAASALGEAAQRQLELVPAARRGQSERAAYATAVMLDSAEREQRSQARAVHSLAALSSLLRTPPATLVAVLQPVLADPHLPQVDVGPPPSEPGFQMLRAPDTDIAGRVNAFMVADQQMQQQAAYARSLQAQYQGVQQAFAAGRVGEFEALVALEAVIAAQDGLAAAMGEQSLAWIALQVGRGPRPASSVT